LFIGPDAPQIEAAVAVGAPVIELHTGAFANAWKSLAAADELERLRAGCELAHRHGLIVNAGHGINYDNIRAILTLPHLHELNIGHSIVARALFTGIRGAVAEMKAHLAKQA
jgi:pyridoxine 5-phosphate synthase